MPRRYQRLPAEGFQTCAQPGQVPARLPGGEVSLNLSNTSGFSSFFLPDNKIARARALPGKHPEQHRNWGFDEEHVHTHSRWAHTWYSLGRCKAFSNPCGTTSEPDTAPEGHFNAVLLLKTSCNSKRLLWGFRAAASAPQVFVVSVP